MRSYKADANVNCRLAIRGISPGPHVMAVGYHANAGKEIAGIAPCRSIETPFRDAGPLTPSPRAKSGLPDFATKHGRSRINPTFGWRRSDEGAPAVRYGFIVTPHPS